MEKAHLVHHCLGRHSQQVAYLEEVDNNSNQLKIVVYSRDSRHNRLQVYLINQLHYLGVPNLNNSLSNNKLIPYSAPLNNNLNNSSSFRMGLYRFAT